MLTFNFQTVYVCGGCGFKGNLNEVTSHSQQCTHPPADHLNTGELTPILLQFPEENVKQDVERKRAEAASCVSPFVYFVSSAQLGPCANVPCDEEM